MKRKLWTMLAVILIILAFPLRAFADAGPKPSITIHCVNLPEGEVYLDLLIDAPPFEHEEGYRYGDYGWAREPGKYDAKMLDVLEAYNEDGWRPALATGTSVPLWGELRLHVSDGNAMAGFAYMGVPDRFKIIIVTQDGKVVVSDVIKRTAFNSVVDLDYAKMSASEIKAVERNFLAQTAKQVAFTLTATYLVEGLILLLFRFSLRQNWKPFVFVNLGTQIALHLIVAGANYFLGTLLAIGFYITFEIGILILETLLFMFHLKQHSKLRRALYAVTANILSFAAGFFLMVLVFALGL